MSLLDRFRGHETQVSDWDALQKSQASKVKEPIKKGYNGKQSAISDPIGPLSLSGINPGYRDKPTLSGMADVNGALKSYSSNIIFNAIVNTRAGQVLTFSQPLRDSEQGVGFEITFQDSKEKPTAKDQQMFAEIEQYIMQMGLKRDNNHMDFHDFIKMFVHDTYTYDQVNWENVYKNGNWQYSNMVDPSTIYFRVDDKGKRVTSGKKYVQVWDNQVRRTFDDGELAMIIRNPQTDIFSSGYGMSELMLGIREFVAHENTEIFNDRFFSHGGTTRGILNLKQNPDSGQVASRQAMDDFKRMWNVSLQGINGSWQIPVVTAPDDIQYVNMTPDARDMEFEKWLNYLIYAISSLFGIDSAEIGFPNRGGATGSRANSLNEGNNAEKIQNSKNRGLKPLLITIEDAINNNLVKPCFGDEYKFRFVGGDYTAELNQLNKVSQQLQSYKTIHEVRSEYGQRGRVAGDDIILNQFAVQRAAQVLQEQQMAHTFAIDAINLMKENATPTGDNGDTPGAMSFQDVQHGFDGKTKPSDRQGTTQDGQVRNAQQTNDRNPNKKDQE